MSKHLITLERNRGDDRCTENDEGYEENSRRNQYYSSRDGGNDSNGEYQQLSCKCDEYHTDSRKPSIFDSKRYEQISIPGPKNASW